MGSDGILPRVDWIGSKSDEIFSRVAEHARLLTSFSGNPYNTAAFPGGNLPLLPSAAAHSRENARSLPSARSDPGRSSRVSASTAAHARRNPRVSPTTPAHPRGNPRVLSGSAADPGGNCRVSAGAAANPSAFRKTPGRVAPTLAGFLRVHARHAVRPGVAAADALRRRHHPGRGAHMALLPMLPP